MIPRWVDFPGFPSRRMLDGGTCSRYLFDMARVLRWNGKDLPDELRDLPAGNYIVEPLDEEALTPEEEAGIEAALESYRQGRVVDADRARAIVDAALKR